MGGKAYKQGLGRGAVEARGAWRTFKRTTSADDLRLDPSSREAVLAEERPLRRHIPDGEWEDFRRGFHDGHVAELKRLARAIAPPSVVKRAPLVCALLDAVGGAAQTDGATVDSSPRRLREGFRVSMSGAGTGTAAAAALGRAAGVREADLAWRTFEATSDIGALRLTRAALAEWSYDVSRESQPEGAAQAHVEFGAAFQAAYSARLGREVNRLVPRRSRDWGAHLLALLRALGLDRPQQESAQ